MKLSHVYGCPVELSLEVLGGKWKPLILARLKEAPMRYGELRRAIPNLSDKMLSQRLSDLEEGESITRSCARNSTVCLYGLSARGRSLQPVLQALYDWGQSNACELGVSFRDAIPGERQLD